MSYVDSVNPYPLYPSVTHVYTHLLIFCPMTTFNRNIISNIRQIKIIKSPQITPLWRCLCLNMKKISEASLDFKKWPIDLLWNIFHTWEHNSYSSKLLYMLREYELTQLLVSDLIQQRTQPILLGHHQYWVNSLLDLGVNMEQEGQEYHLIINTHSEPSLILSLYQITANLVDWNNTLLWSCYPRMQMSF